MRLYYAPSSPFARKALIILHETRQLPDVALASVYGTPLDPGSMPVGLNPLGKLPT